MTGAHEEERPRPDRKRYVIGQYVGNLVGSAIATVALAWVVFDLFGSGSGNQTEVQAFMMVFVLCFTVIQPHTALVNTRRDYVKGKWVKGNDDPAVEPDQIVNPWKRIGPWALPAGAAAALAAVLAVPHIGKEPYPRTFIYVTAFAVLFFVSTPLIGIILRRDQISIAAMLERTRQERPEPFASYFIIEHVGPWMIIQGLINLGVGLKQFTHEVGMHAERGGVIPASMLGTDLGIVFGIVTFFMFLASDGQVRLDLRLGRVSERSFRWSGLEDLHVGVVAVLLVLSLALVMLVTAVAMTGTFYVGGLESFSIAQAAVMKILSAALACIAGCGAGIWWGTRRETALMRSGD